MQIPYSFAVLKLAPSGLLFPLPGKGRKDSRLFPRGSRLKISQTTHSASGTFEERAYASSTLRTIRNLYRTNLWLHGGGSTVTRQPIGASMLGYTTHPPLLSFSPPQAKYRVYNTVLLASGNSLPAITLVVRTVSLPYLTVDLSSKATDVRVIGPIPLPERRDLPATCNFRSSRTLCSSFDSTILDSLLFPLRVKLSLCCASRKFAQ